MLLYLYKFFLNKITKAILEINIIFQSNKIKIDTLVIMVCTVFFCHKAILLD